jgi:hypothetical protein
LLVVGDGLPDEHVETTSISWTTLPAPRAGNIQGLR